MKAVNLAMTEYVIRPWINDCIENPDMNVPPEVETVAHEVLKHYDMQVHDMRLITAKSDKGGAIWKISTNCGNRSLKVLHRETVRSLFSIHAQEYMVNQGARVPQLTRTKQGEMLVNAGGKSWIVTDWIEPLTPVSKVDLEGAKELCYALGEFHRLSRGYNPPPEAYRATRLQRWPKTYKKIHTKIGWFRTLAEIYSDLPGSETLLSVVGQFEQQAASAVIRLHDSPYANLTSLGESYWGIVHQDYGWSNGQKGPDGMWIIDLDGVAFDLPIRDLRKLIGSTMNDMGSWDVEWISGMIDAYHEACPIERDLYEVLLIDLSLPNEFYKDVKEIVYDPTLFLTNELVLLLTRLQETDKTKWPVLEELRAKKEVLGK